MSNLAIENLSGVLQDSLMPSVSSNTRVLDEMRKNGMEAQPPAAGDNAKTFSGMLKDSMEQVNQAQVESDVAIKNLVAGRSKNIHETMLAVEKADTSLKLMVQIRNKILDAYKEVMRMQV